MREDLALRLERFKEQWSVDAAAQGRVARPMVKFIGEEVLDTAVAALLQGENLLLAGGKATGKNVLADNLAWLFARPVFTASFHVNTDSSMLIGTDTFTGGEVRLRRGPIALAAQYGGFCVLDEINMAKNDAVAVLHSVLDYRRLIDVPGYECIPLHPATRFIATMNYGYAGTRELNEALAGTNYILNVHLKLDTGMTRIGFFAYDNDRTLDELKQVAALTHLHIEGVFMHFCVADSRAEEDVLFTKLQYKRFMDMLSAMEGAGIRPEIRHCCNSGAAILYPEFALDMVRPGIITYGNAPSEELEGAISLRPMMSLHSMIAQVRTVPAGTDISYGRLYRTTHDTRVAVLPIGYADGLSRLLTGKASFYLQGKLVPVIGRICMDMCMLDVSEVPDAKPGDIVTIFGYDDDGTLVPCERLAAAQGTINYELLCQISKRIPRICHRGTETSQILQYIV